MSKLQTSFQSSVRVNAAGAVVLHDARLHPGDVVEVTVRPLTSTSAVMPLAKPSFLEAAKAAAIVAPPDFSERFDDPLRLEA